MTCGFGEIRDALLLWKWLLWAAAIVLYVHSYTRLRTQAKTSYLQHCWLKWEEELGWTIM